MKHRGRSKFPQDPVQPRSAEAPLRVAYVVNQYPKVSHSFIRREILALEALGVEVLRIAIRGWDAELVDEEDRAERGRTVFVLQGGATALVGAMLRVAIASPQRFARVIIEALRSARGSDRAWWLHVAYVAEACWVVPRLRDAGVAHVHAHFGTNAAEVAMRIRALGGPGFSFTVHGPEEFDKPAALQLKQKAEAARFVVAISSYGRSQLYRWLEHHDWPKVQIVHCGLEPLFYQQPAASPSARARLVCVGRLCEQKGQMLLLDATRRLIEREVEFELVLAGDGELRADLEARIEVLGLQDVVRITGWISSGQVRQELIEARALVLPSFAEGLPVVIMEAMALGRPVISTYVAGIPELVLDQHCGWLVPAGDVERLAEAMEACLNAPAERLANMAGRARARVLARHAIMDQAAHLRQLMRQAIASEMPAWPR